MSQSLTRPGTYWLIVILVLPLVSACTDTATEPTNATRLAISIPVFTVTDSIDLLGEPTSILVSPTQRRAFIGTRAALVTLNLDTRALSEAYTYGTEYDYVDDIHPDGALVCIRSSNQVGVFDLINVVTRTLLSEGWGYRKGALSRDRLYFANSNRQSIYSVGLDGSDPREIDLYADADMTARPNACYPVPDRSRILVTDENNQALHVLDTSTEGVTNSLFMGLEQPLVTALGNDMAAVAEALGDRVLLMDLSAPPHAVPRIARHDSVRKIRAITSTPGGSAIYMLVAAEIHDRYGSARWHVPQVVILDQTGQRVLQRIPIGSETTHFSLDAGIAVTGDGKTVLAFWDTTLYFLDSEPELQIGKTAHWSVSRSQ